MQKRLVITCVLLALCGCANRSIRLDADGARLAVNTPGTIADLQSVHSRAEYAELRRRYAIPAPMTVINALESYVPADYTILPDAGVDLGRELQLERSQHWTLALPTALARIGIQAQFDENRKTVRLRNIREVATGSRI